MEVSGQLQATDALPGGNIPQYTLVRRLDGPQSQHGRGGEEEESIPYRESSPGRTACSLVTILTELHRLTQTPSGIKNVTSTDLRIARACVTS
jgi:hypothetical protein